MEQPTINHDIFGSRCVECDFMQQPVLGLQRAIDTAIDHNIETDHKVEVVYVDKGDVYTYHGSR